MDESITLESVLSSVVRVTEQRSQQHLEESLVKTLTHLAGLEFCGICRPGLSGGGILVDYVAVAGRPALESMDETGDDPLLREALAVGASRFHVLAGGGVRRALAITDDHGDVGAFLVTLTSAGKVEQVGLIEGFAAIYRNYLAILRDAARDTLTGLRNRKTFDENFSRIVASSRHLAVPFHGDRRAAHLDGEHHWLGIIDIDHFKRVNDSFGHVFGDEVLLLLAALMRKAFRVEDLLFRFGGEEFVVMLSPTTYDGAGAVFERFRSIVAGFAFPQVGKVTVSIGFVRILPEDLPSVVIGRADRALYFAKANGRDQVRSFERLVGDGHLTDEERSGDDPELF
ncbi:GGDEF domain-containing protein [Magnetospirillum sp. SS-4]|uniref:GGDEF domain-containing protein n=1 Tax=Magnetospirillum sp. SS-4 TaxID=2681465 RepID=UPI00137E827A|nr:GGDEF domain-containing protein [Magnetospirillum sp. SS-4]CAA7612567.1 GGDEF domain-containing protein [Magnetospirillum sp. SS-4]